jgi:hypothetical protein
MNRIHQEVDMAARSQQAKSRALGIALVAGVLVVAAIGGSYLIGPATDPQATSSVTAPAQGEPENLAAPGNPAGGTKP